MPDKFEVILKKNGKKVRLPVDTLWLEDDGVIIPTPCSFTTGVPVYRFIRKFDARFDHSMAARYSHPAFE